MRFKLTLVSLGLVAVGNVAGCASDVEPSSSGSLQGITGSVAAPGSEPAAGDARPPAAWQAGGPLAAERAVPGFMRDLSTNAAGQLVIKAPPDPNPPVPGG
jgi:hypothetical protein